MRRWFCSGLLAGALIACQGAPPQEPRVVEVSPAAAPAAPCRWREAERLADEAAALARLDVDGAVALYRRAITLAPEDAGLAAALADALGKKEDWAPAAAEARRSAELAPGRADFWQQWAMNSARATALPGEAAARWRDAEEGARRCLALDQRRAECHAILGQARRQAGDERGAVAALDEAARQAPQVLRYRVSLADLYAQIEEFERAVAVLRDGLKLAPEADPERSAALLALGSSLQATGALPEALATLEQARQADREGKNQEILFALATVHASLQPPRRQEALQLFKAFMVRMCKGSRAALHVRQCEAAQVGALTMGAGLE